MKLAPVLLLSVAILTVLHANKRIKNVELISAAEAESMIIAEEKAKADRRAEVQALIDSAYVEEEFTHQKSGQRKMVLRRVKPSRELLEAAKDKLVQEFKTEEALSVEIAPFIRVIDEHRLENLSLVVTNFDDLYSRVKWRYEDHEFEIWSNIQLSYLHSIGNFEYNEVNYNYFGFFDLIESEVEKERAATYTFHGHKYESRWEDPPVRFGREPEYAVVAEDPESVPEKLYEQMDAVYGYYLENEEKLRTHYTNLRTMNQVREKYKAEHPEPKRDRVMIMWPKEK